MDLRAFTSQLQCELVVGRGLRRTSYDVNPETGLFEPEHVNVFGVPFTFLPHESRGDGPPPPPTPKTAIEPVTKARSGLLDFLAQRRAHRSLQPPAPVARTLDDIRAFLDGNVVLRQMAESLEDWPPAIIRAWSARWLAVRIQARERLARAIRNDESLRGVLTRAECRALGWDPDTWRYDQQRRRGRDVALSIPPEGGKMSEHESAGRREYERPTIQIINRVESPPQETQKEADENALSRVLFPIAGAIIGYWVATTYCAGF